MRALSKGQLLPINTIIGLTATSQIVASMLNRFY